MLSELFNDLTWAIGAGSDFENISPGQVVFRTAVIFVVALVLIRVGKRRFMGDYTAFDILLGFIVGSVMARAVTGAVSLVNMILIVVVLMGLHWLVATVSYYLPAFEKVVENDPRKLIDNGKIDRDALEKSKISDDDLLQALREHGGVEKAEDVKTATLERDGSITVIPIEKD
ncbi:MAG TPA: YetF domain-containing protein [Pyrinomonadaceae bacterium]|nr:YetF domain-containing protein [Pyrinomonadaceae bacterium]